MPLFGPPDIKTLSAKHDVRGLSKALKYKKDSRVRFEAARALQEMADPRSIRALVGALSDGSERVRSAAAEALVKIGPPAVKGLVASLRHSETATRALSAEALGRIGNRPAVEPLLRALGDERTAVLEAAAGALAHMPDQRSVAPLVSGLGHKYGSVREAHRRALVAIGEGAVEALTGALEAGSFYVQEQAGIALGEIGSAKGAPALVHALSSGSASSEARQALAAIGPPAVDSLIEALHDEKHQRRTSVAYALGEIGDLRAIPHLAQVVQDQGDGLAETAILALGMIGDPQAAPVLVDALRREQPNHKRDTTIESLTRIGEAGADAVVPALRDPKREVRRAAAKALRAMGWYPRTDRDQVVYRLANRQVYRLSEPDARDFRELLLDSLEWDMAWYVKGRVAHLLLGADIDLEVSETTRAMDVYERFIKRRAKLIRRRLRRPQKYPWIDKKQARLLFEDYAELVSKASTYTSHSYTRGVAGTRYAYQTEESLAAVERLCRIQTSISSNLLRHISRLRDIRVVDGVYEVPYSTENPGGMASKKRTLSFEKHRQAAKKELARRGNPPYDPTIHEHVDCWSLPKG